MTATGRVLYIGGWGRSGSTLLDRVLGQVPGVFSAGEIREIWERGCLENRPCGCDEPFGDCALWREVGRVGFGGWEKLDLPEVLDLRFTLDRPWMVPTLALRRRPGSLGGRIRRYADILDALYRAIFQVTGAEVLVDSSKLPSHAFILRELAWLDLRVLHLVRDSRGVAHSWSKVVEKKVTAGEPRYLPRYGPLSSSLRWLVYNAQTTALGRFGLPVRRLRYEDFVEAPRLWTERILSFAGMSDPTAELPFSGPAEAVLGPNHTVDGNPIRFATGPIEIQADDAWRLNLTPGRRRLVTVATLPSLLRYGYRPFGPERTLSSPGRRMTA